MAASSALHHRCVAQTALGAAVLTLLVANTIASSAKVSPKTVSLSPSFEATFEEAVARRGWKRRSHKVSHKTSSSLSSSTDEKCLQCCDKGCKKLQSAKKCEDINGTTGEAAGKHAEEVCNADGLTCTGDDACLCIWMYHDKSLCKPGINRAAPRDCTVVLPHPPMSKSVCSLRGETWSVFFAMQPSDLEFFALQGRPDYETSGLCRDSGLAFADGLGAFIVIAILFCIVGVIFFICLCCVCRDLNKKQVKPET